jgi:hypothetical protein
MQRIDWDESLESVVSAFSIFVLPITIQHPYFVCYRNIANRHNLHTQSSFVYAIDKTFSTIGETVVMNQEIHRVFAFALLSLLSEFFYTLICLLSNKLEIN